MLAVGAFPSTVSFSAVRQFNILSCGMRDLRTIHQGSRSRLDDGRIVMKDLMILINSLSSLAVFAGESKKALSLCLRLR